MVKIRQYILIISLIIMNGCAIEPNKDNQEFNIVSKVNYDINNNFKYIKDIRNYQSKDYFADLNEFKANKGGDCEDFCIAKYTILTEKFNLDKNKFKFLLLKHRQKSRYVYHMVLAFKDNNAEYFLDNDNDHLYTRLNKRKVQYYSWTEVEKWIGVKK